MVKFSLALLSGFASIGAFSSNAEDVLPPRFNFERYTRMVDKSPFAVATAAVLPEATPNFARDLYIANAAHSSEGDMVTIMSSSDHNFKKYLSTRQTVDGYSIAQIEWSEDVGKTKVTISKDGQVATLTFNQSLLSQTAPPGRTVANRTLPNVPIIASQGADSVPRARPRSATERAPKINSALPSNSTDGGSDSLSAPAVRVPPPAVALPKQLGSNQDVSEKEQQ